MDTQTIIDEVKGLMSNIQFPAHKQEVVQQAQQQGASPETQQQLQQLPEQKFGSMGELLAKIPGIGTLEGEVEKFL